MHVTASTRHVDSILSIASYRTHLVHMYLRLEVILKIGILLSKFQQHVVVEEPVDAHILLQTFSAPRLDHKLACQRLQRARFQRLEDNALVQRIAWHDVPVVKESLRERLAFRVGAKVGLEAERVDDWDARVHSVERSPSLGERGIHVPAATRQHVVDGRYTVRRTLDLYEVNRFHQPRGREEERRIRHAPRRRDDLSAAAVDGVLGDVCVQKLELDVSDGLVAQRPFAGSPLESLHDALLDGAEPRLVYLRCERVVDEDVGPRAIRSESPYRPCCENVPVVLGLEEVCDSLVVPG
mmetsp:Transcript_19933/g.35566  ORF Transcript_19933/g.35566 Transcript_19933/m.35566 type:complete len:296 (-) Transcript_19933:1848-2735(-)